MVELVLQSGIDVLVFTAGVLILLQLLSPTHSWQAVLGRIALFVTVALGGAAVSLYVITMVAYGEPPWSQVGDVAQVGAAYVPGKLAPLITGASSSVVLALTVARGLHSAKAAGYMFVIFGSTALAALFIGPSISTHVDDCGCSFGGGWADVRIATDNIDDVAGEMRVEFGGETYPGRVNVVLNLQGDPLSQGRFALNLPHYASDELTVEGADVWTQAPFDDAIMVADRSGPDCLEETVEFISTDFFDSGMAGLVTLDAQGEAVVEVSFETTQNKNLEWFVSKPGYYEVTLPSASLIVDSDVACDAAPADASAWRPASSAVLTLGPQFALGSGDQLLAQTPVEGEIVNSLLTWKQTSEGADGGIGVSASYGLATPDSTIQQNVALFLAALFASVAASALVILAQRIIEGTRREAHLAPVSAAIPRALVKQQPSSPAGASTRPGGVILSAVAVGFLVRSLWDLLRRRKG